MSNNSQQQELPENTKNRIKNAIFKIFHFPVEAIEYVDVHIDNFLGKTIVKIRTSVQEEEQDVKDLVNKIVNHDRFSRDAVNSAENVKEYTLTPPENVQNELKQLADIQNNKLEEGVVHKEQVVNDLITQLEQKSKSTSG